MELIIEDDPCSIICAFNNLFRIEGGGGPPGDANDLATDSTVFMSFDMSEWCGVVWAVDTWFRGERAPKRLGLATFSNFLLAASSSTRLSIATSVFGCEIVLLVRSHQCGGANNSFKAKNTLFGFAPSVDLRFSNFLHFHSSSWTRKLVFMSAYTTFDQVLIFAGPMRVDLQVPRGLQESDIDCFTVQVGASLWLAD